MSLFTLSCPNIYGKWGINSISGLTYLNGLFDLLKDLAFHLHLVNGKSKKTVSMDFSSASQDM